jgi:RNA polymerase sigma factor (sigma-70 family)
MPPLSTAALVSIGPPKAEQEAEVANLVRAAAGGDVLAWEELVERFAGLVWAITRAYRLSPTDAADVSQTAWLRLVEHLHRLREPGRVGAWLAATTRRECLLVQKRARRLVPTEADALDRPDLAEPGALVALIESERDAMLWRAFERLDDRCRMLLRLLMADPTPSYDEVAAAVDMPPASIGPTRSRCLQRLRTRLATSGIETATGDSF